MINHFNQDHNLNGLRVLNTRPKEQGTILSQAIENAGGTAIACPALEIIATNNTWLNSLPALNLIDQAIFISANAVNYFFHLLNQRNINWPKSILSIAIGQATARALQQQNISIISMPTVADSDHLINLPSLHQISNQNLLLIKGVGGRRLISKTLKQRQAKLYTLNVYRRALPQKMNKELQRLWRNDCIDIILLTSQHAIKNLFILFGKQAKEWLCQTPCLVLSQRLARIASSFGIKKIIICQPQAILDALHQFKQGLTDGEPK